MTKVIRAEVYKLFHSFYYWGIALGYFAFASILTLDHINMTTYLRSSMYPISFMLFFVIGLAIVMIGNEFSQRQIQGYIAAGNKRIEVFGAKMFVYLACSVGMIVVTLLLHGLAGLIIRGEAIEFGTILFLIPSFIGICLIPAFFAFLFRDVGKTLGGGLVFYCIMLFTLNTKGFEKFVYLPYGHSLLGWTGELQAAPERTGLLLIDLAWIAVFLIGSYMAMRRSDLK